MRVHMKHYHAHAGDGVLCAIIKLLELILLLFWLILLILLVVIHLLLGCLSGCHCCCLHNCCWSGVDAVITATKVLYFNLSLCAAIVIYR